MKQAWRERKIAGILVALIAAGVGQAPERTHFEVASIKPSPPAATSFVESGGPGTSDPALWRRENADLASLIVGAYGIPYYRFSGPAWLRSTRFNITAKIPDGANKDEFKSMQQNLLIERFRMTMHHEQKEVQAYDLVVAKNGAKLKESTEAPPAGDPYAYKPPPGPFKKDRDGFPIIPPEDHRPMMSAMEGNRWVQRFDRRSMEQLAAYLSGPLARPVNDATGLKGKYDFDLKWVMDRGRPSPDGEGPNLFEALQEQLGLKLEPKKALIDVLVIDHIEKTPTEN